MGYAFGSKAQGSNKGKDIITGFIKDLLTANLIIGTQASALGEGVRKPVDFENLENNKAPLIYRLSIDILLIERA